MKFFTKKRIVLFLLFIFPLICFLLLSTGINNASKLPIYGKNAIDISAVDATKTLKKKISIICFLGEDITKNKGGVFNLSQNIYKKFIKHNDFQIIAIYPKGNEKEILKFKKELSAFTDMVKWKFTAASREDINILFNSFETNTTLDNFYSSDAFLLDKNGYLRARTDDKEEIDRKLIGYNMNSVADLKKIMKDDINALYYEYYAAFKNKNKADRKEIGS
ncbi:MAG: hypothetical protein ACI9JT_001445 [Polaribacter sp.]|jgi:hypothetical protein